jgi:hypothetical protein
MLFKAAFDTNFNSMLNLTGTGFMIHLLVHLILTKKNMSELAAGMDAVQLKRG